jgi:hypothetical protein
MPAAQMQLVMIRLVHGVIGSLTDIGKKAVVSDRFSVSR